MSDVRIDGERLWRSLMDLARIGATPKGGVARLALTDRDREGRDWVVARAREAGMGREELEALDIEMRAPLTLQQLVVRTPTELRDETFAAALIAVTADTEEENRFLDELAAQLQLDAQAQGEIRRQLGI